MHHYARNYHLGSFSINDNERELRTVLDEIIQAYLKYNHIGWTKSLNFDKVLEKYKSKSREIFNYLVKNLTIQHYEVLVGKFYNKEFGIDKNKNVALEWYAKASQQGDIYGHYEVGLCYYYGVDIVKNYEKAFAFF